MQMREEEENFNDTESALVTFKCKNGDSISCRHVVSFWSLSVALLYLSLGSCILKRMVT